MQIVHTTLIHPKPTPCTFSPPVERAAYSLTHALNWFQTTMACLNITGAHHCWSYDQPEPSYGKSAKIVCSHCRAALLHKTHIITKKGLPLQAVIQSGSKQIPDGSRMQLASLHKCAYHSVGPPVESGLEGAALDSVVSVSLGAAPLTVGLSTGTPALQMRL